jgi:hypothetical protein
MTYDVDQLIGLQGIRRTMRALNPRVLLVAYCAWILYLCLVLTRNMIEIEFWHRFAEWFVESTALAPFVTRIMSITLALARDLLLLYIMYDISKFMRFAVENITDDLMTHFWELAVKHLWVTKSMVVWTIALELYLAAFVCVTRIVYETGWDSVVFGLHLLLCGFAVGVHSGAFNHPRARTILPRRKIR